MQIINHDGVVVAEAKCRKNNEYKIKIGPSLTPGVYRFQIRAVDSVGHLSRLSRPFYIKVVPRRHQIPVTIGAAATPAGPLGTKS
jgi:hypothetical protein